MAMGLSTKRCTIVAWRERERVKAHTKKKQQKAKNECINKWMFNGLDERIERRVKNCLVFGVLCFVPVVWFGLFVVVYLPR